MTLLELASKETLSDYDTYQLPMDMAKALNGEPPTDRLEFIKWNAQWRAKLKMIRAKALMDESAPRLS